MLLSSLILGTVFSFVFLGAVIFYDPADDMWIRELNTVSEHEGGTGDSEQEEGVSEANEQAAFEGKNLFDMLSEKDEPVFVPIVVKSVKPVKIGIGKISLRFYDGSVLGITIDYSDVVRSMFDKETANLPQQEQNSKEVLEKLAMKCISSVCAEASGMLQKYSDYALNGPAGGIAIAGGGYWIGASGNGMFADGKNGGGCEVPGYFASHHVFLKLGLYMLDGNYELTMPTGQKVSFVFDSRTAESSLFKLDRLGYVPEAARKYIYLGAWLGNAGALDIGRLYERECIVYSKTSQKPVLTGIIRLPGRGWSSVQPSRMSTGEVTGEVDISELRTPGVYYAHIPDVGRSPDFRIGDSVITDAFHEYQSSTANACQVFHDCTKPGAKKDGEVKCLIHSSCKQGKDEGKNSMADFGTVFLPSRVIGDMLSGFLSNRKAFVKTDGQVRGQHNKHGDNGDIPEILWDAYLFMERWRGFQQPEGLVPLWEVMYCPGQCEYRSSIEIPSRRSTMEYAAYSSMLSICFREAEDISKSEVLTRSAKGAFEAAINLNDVGAVMGEDKQIISDGAQLPIINRVNLARGVLMKAASNLYYLTEDEKYLSVLKNMEAYWEDAIREVIHRISPMFFSEMEVLGGKCRKLSKLRTKYRKCVIELADERMNEVAGMVNKISWTQTVKVEKMVQCLPLQYARTWVMSWKMTGEHKYKDAAFLALNWHNGGNPAGMPLKIACIRVPNDISGTESQAKQGSPEKQPKAVLTGNDSWQVAGSNGFRAICAWRLPHGAKHCVDGARNMGSEPKGNVKKLPLCHMALLPVDYDYIHSFFSALEAAGTASSVTAFLLPEEYIHETRTRGADVDNSEINDVKKRP